MSEKDVFSIDFGALKAQAAEMLDKVEQAPEPGTPAVTPPEQPVKAAEVDPTEVRVKGSTEEKPKVETKADDPAVEPEQKFAELNDDALVKVTVDGKDLVLPWKEARGRISGGTKFTQNMQDLAKQRKEFDGERARLTALEQENNGYKALLRDKNALSKVIQAVHGISLEAQAAEPISSNDPNEIATVGQAEAFAKAQAQTVQQLVEDTKKALEQKIVDTQMEIDFNRKKAAHEVVINGTLNDIFTKNPVLKSIPNVEDLIRFEVSKMATQEWTEKEALEAFHIVSKGIVEELGQHFKAQTTIRAIQKEKLESKTIEPAGGAAPQLKPTSFKNSDGSVDWAKVKKAALDYSS
jgi:hypothetical protein